MMCYLDMTFCEAACENFACRRKFTDADRDKARQWWGGDNAPVAFSDFSPKCIDYQPAQVDTDAKRQDPKGLGPKDSGPVGDSRCAQTISGEIS